MTLGGAACWLVASILCLGGLGGLLESEREDAFLGTALALAGVLTLPPTARWIERRTGMKLAPAFRVGLVLGVLLLVRVVKGGQGRLIVDRPADSLARPSQGRETVIDFSVR